MIQMVTIQREHTGRDGARFARLKTNAWNRFVDQKCELDGTASSTCHQLVIPFTKKDMLCLVESRNEKLTVKVEKNEPAVWNHDWTTVRCATHFITNLTLNPVGGTGKVGFNILAQALLEDRAFCNLTTLSVWRNNIGEDGAKLLADVLAGNNLPKLNALDCRLSGISEAGMSAIFNALAVNPSRALKNLQLNGNRTGLRGMTACVTAIKKGALDSIDALDMTYNWILEGEVTLLSSAISRHRLRSLTNLNLSLNSFGEVGMAELCIAMSNMDNLRHLNLAYTKVGDVGMVELAEATTFGSLKNMVTLALHSNDIGDDGIIAFCNAVKGTPLLHLQNLLLMRNRLTDISADAFLNALESIPSIQILDLRHNRINASKIKDVQWSMNILRLTRQATAHKNRSQPANRRLSEF